VPASQAGNNHTPWRNACVMPVTGDPQNRPVKSRFFDPKGLCMRAAAIGAGSGGRIAGGRLNGKGEPAISVGSKPEMPHDESPQDPEH
jgi:hypothetical protein